MFWTRVHGGHRRRPVAETAVRPRKKGKIKSIRNDTKSQRNNDRSKPDLIGLESRKRTTIVILTKIVPVVGRARSGDNKRQINCYRFT